MSTTTFHSVAGGSGTTTVALAYAVKLAAHFPDRAHTISSVTSEIDVLGMGGTSGTHLTDNLRLDVFGTGDVHDAGVVREVQTASELDRSYLVLRGPSFNALKRATLLGVRPTGVIVVAEDGRSLDGRDVEDVLGVRVVATIPVDPQVARTVDAGLFVARLPRAFRELDRLVLDNYETRV